jgi:hypothetical protein
VETLLHPRLPDFDTRRGDFPAFSISTLGGWTKPPSASVYIYSDAERMDDTLIYPDFDPRRDKPLLGPYVRVNYRGEDKEFVCIFLCK